MKGFGGYPGNCKILNNRPKLYICWGIMGIGNKVLDKL